MDVFFCCWPAAAVVADSLRCTLITTQVLIQDSLRLKLPVAKLTSWSDGIRIWSSSTAVGIKMAIHIGPLGERLSTELALDSCGRHYWRQLFAKLDQLISCHNWNGLNGLKICKTMLAQIPEFL